jgi:cell division protein FtsN
MVEHSGKTLIVSVLASSRLWNDVSELFLYGFSATGSGEPRFVPLSNMVALPAPLPVPPPERKPVERKLLEPKPREQKKGSARGGNGSAYTVQVGAFREKRLAEILRQRLQQSGYSAQVMTSGTRAAKFYKVRLGEFDTQGEAKRFVGRLKSQMGLDAVVAVSD